ncbi:MAG TPA: POTRA domain-containing protein [Pyrinomonadaceae bacterium]|nr:POTRA domain-containing protein [Pyrinomonadaceae bacterium]
MIISAHHSKPTLRAIVLLATLIASASMASAQAGRLTKIDVVGLKRIPPAQVIAASELKIGQAVDPSVLDAAATKLMQSGLFKKLTYRVRGRVGEVTVIFEVEEANRSLPVVFENFVWFTDEELASAIRNDIPFFNGTAPEAGDATEKIVQSLQRLLNERKIPGRVEVMPYTDLAKGTQEFLFTVRGVKIPVCSLSFPGAEAVSEAELIKASQPLINSDFSRKDISAFATYTLFPLYRRLGRLRAQFREPAAAKAENLANCVDGVTVTVPVDEGIVYSWAKSDWTGNQSLSPTELSAALGMKSGEIADGSRIDAGLKEVRTAYGRKGYLVVRIKESSQFDDSAHWVSYQFAVSEGPQYHMGNLIINGMAPDLTQNLKESWTLQSGAVFDESYVDDFRLNALPRFIGTQMQRSLAFHATAQTVTRPDAQKLTVDVIITFK